MVIPSYKTLCKGSREGKLNIQELFYLCNLHNRQNSLSNFDISSYLNHKICPISFIYPDEAQSNHSTKYLKESTILATIHGHLLGANHSLAKWDIYIIEPSMDRYMVAGPCQRMLSLLQILSQKQKEIKSLVSLISFPSIIKFLRKKEHASIRTATNILDGMKKPKKGTIKDIAQCHMNALHQLAKIFKVQPIKSRAHSKE